MLNKHLNERGRNWLQVFKSLQVVDYCLHMGSENVIIYFRDNVNVLKALTEFQFIDEEGKDQGVNIRQNAKDIVSLLDDEDCLREQRRARARFGMDRTIGGTPTLGDNTMKADVDVLPSHSQSEEDKLQYALESSDEEAPYKSSRNTSPSPDPTLRLPLPHPILPNLPPPVATDELEIAAAENETFTIPNTFWKDGKAEPVASQQQHISGAEPRSDGLNNRRSVADVLLLSGSHNSATTADLDVDAAQPQRPAKVVRRLSARIGDFFRPVGGVPTNPEDLQVDVKVGKVSMQQTGMKEEQQPYGPVGRPGRNNELRVGDNAPLSIVGNANDPTTTRDNGAAPPRKRAKIGHRLSTRVGDFFRSKEASKDLRVIRGDSNGEGDMQPKRMDNSQVDTKEQEEPSEKTAAEVATGEGTPYLSSITSQPPRGPTRLLETILSNPEHYRHLLKCSDADAEIILEFFQSLLDSSDLANDIRRQITTAMQRLAGKTKRFPSYFFIREAVSLTSEDAVNSGGFGEVYEARLNGEALCLKVLRANQAILDKLAKSAPKVAATRPDMLTIVSRLKLECPAVDPRPAPQWPAGSAMRFRQKSSDTQHSLETLNETLSRAAGVV
ncbi:hypothetical protein H0H87_008937 [Tephrocybe sp. NHM501043]|nr:hypothetical protein H0H87_008937 [Tephrocybe sp. NHM501043]